MKSLQIHLTEYIAARRTLGTRLEAPAKTLRHFIKFLAHKNSEATASDPASKIIRRPAPSESTAYL